MLHFLMKSHCGVKGQVKNDATGEPIENATVTVEEYTPVSTTKDGEYWKLLLPDSGTYKVVR